MGTKLRKLFPPSGPQYALFDLSVALWFVTLCVYVLTRSSRSAAQAWLTTDGQFLGGVAVVLIGVAATVLSYSWRTTGLGLGLVSTAGFIWSAALIVGVLVDFRWSSLGLAVVYAYFAQHARKIACEA